MLTKRWNLNILILLLCLIFGGCKPTEAPQKPAETSSTPGYLTGAYYNIWYPDAFRNKYLRKKLSPPQQPVLGEYNSEDVTVAERHIAWASRYGVDFFCIDFWPGWSYIEDRIDVFLGAKNIEDIQFCIFYETQALGYSCLLYTSPSPRDQRGSRMPSSA